MAQLVEHHLAKVRVAGSNPVVRSRRSVCPCGMPLVAEWPSGLGKGLQSPVHGFDSRLRLHDSPDTERHGPMRACRFVLPFSGRVGACVPQVPRYAAGMTAAVPDARIPAYLRLSANGQLTLSY